MRPGARRRTGEQRVVPARLDIGGTPALGLVIKQLRQARELTQASLAMRAGMSPNAIGGFERGEVQNPGLVGITRVALALDVSVAVFGAAFVLPVGSVAMAAVLSGHPRAQAQRPGLSRRSSESDGPRALGATLHELRGRAGMTQVALARAAQLGSKYISDLERGATKEPGLLTIATLADGVSPPDAGVVVVAGVVARLACAFVGESFAAPRVQEYLRHPRSVA